MRCFLAVLLLLSWTFYSEAQRQYKVVASRFSDKPILSKQQGSAYDFNYNSAVYSYNGKLGLVVRVQNLNDTRPFIVGPSYLAYSQITFDTNGMPVATQPDKNVFQPNQNSETCGTEDPRVSFSNGTYYLMYTAYDCKRAMLSAASTKTPDDPKTWQRIGDPAFVFPARNWSKSGAVLWATPDNKLTQNYLFWGDSSTPSGGIGIATSTSTTNWNDTGLFLIRARNTSGYNTFDTGLVESGPSPLPLKSGDFLFIYNSARQSNMSVKPGWSLEYNVGYAILDGKDPTRVVARSDTPIMSPTTTWEIGNSTDYLTPFVVFLEGLVPDPNGCPTNVSAYIGADFAANAECFFGVYGGADSDLGAVRIISSWKDTNPPTSTSTPTSTTTTTSSTPSTAVVSSVLIFLALTVSKILC